MVTKDVTLELDESLTENAPKISNEEYDPTIVAVIDAWMHNDFMCRNILNGLENTLYDVYILINSVKAL